MAIKKQKGKSLPPYSPKAKLRKFILRLTNSARKFTKAQQDRFLDEASA